MIDDGKLLIADLFGNFHSAINHQSSISNQQ